MHGNNANTYVTWQIYAIYILALWVLLQNCYFPSTNTLFHFFMNIYLQIFISTCTKNHPFVGMHNKLTLQQKHTIPAVPNMTLTCYIQSQCCHTISHFSYISKYFLPIMTTKSWVTTINQCTKPLVWWG